MKRSLRTKLSRAFDAAVIISVILGAIYPWGLPSWAIIFLLMLNVYFVLDRIERRARELP